MKELLNRIKLGDKKALETFYKKHRKKFVQYLKYKFDNLLDEEILTIYHESLLAFQRQVIKNIPIEHPKNYLNKIGFHKANTYQINKKKRQIEESNQSITDTQYMINEENEWSDEKEYLVKAIEKLNEPDKKLVLLLFYKKYSIEAIAEELGVSPNTCTKRKTRVLEKLRLHIKTIKEEERNK